MKKIIPMIGLCAFTMLFYACAPAYVTKEPTYFERERPLRPSPLHIWIDGDWKWNKSSHGYIHNNGYWAPPQRKKTFVPGYWARGKRGSYWKNGHWQ